MLDRHPTAETPDLAAALERRYGAPQAIALPASAPSDETLRTLIGHRSCRAYLDAPLPEGALALAIAAAQSAANSSNLQSWSVVAVDDPELKARLNVFAGNQSKIDEAPLLLVWLADLGKLRRIAEPEGNAGEAVDYLEMLVTGIIDASLAAEAAAVAFEAQGLGICFIGGIRNQAHRVAAELGLPPEVFPTFGMTVGHRDPARPDRVKPRLRQDAVLHVNRYDAAPAATAVEGYNLTLRGFQAAEGLLAGDWSRAVANRIGSPAALKGREHLTAYLHDLGFQLK